MISFTHNPPLVMKTKSLDSFRHYMEAQSGFAEGRIRRQLPAITISREAGAGAVTIGNMLVEELDRRYPGDPPCPWTLLDRNLTEKVVQDHNLPAAIERYMPEDAIFPVNDAVENLLGLHPLSWTLVEQTTATIRRLALSGNVILVGRASFIIGARLPHVFHIRLVAPFEQRVRQVSQYYNVQPAAAARKIHELDEGRRRYVKTYFSVDIDDPIHYHLTLNTALTGFQRAARLIADLVLTHEQGFSPPKSSEL
jgi:hypothetical protein